MNKKRKFFVVSLPRTGTTSILKMAKICGFNPKYCPHINFDPLLESSKVDFFSDTPVFSPGTIDYILLQKDVDPYFIYIDKNYLDILNSWKKTNLFYNYQHIVKTFNEHREDILSTILFDYESYTDAFGGNILTEDNYEDLFANHKNMVYRKILESDKPLLVYNFNSGWKPFCDFLGVDIPNEEIPILNKDTMFEGIN